MRLRAAATAVLLCAACTVPIDQPQQSEPVVVPAPAADATVAAAARAVLEAVNAARAGNGVPALRADAALNRAASEHAEELAERRTLDHSSVDPDRRTMTTRIEAVGGTWLRAAENLANMSGSASSVPEQTVQMWLTSAGHRRNMLSSGYSHTGVGVAVDRRGIWYVTQLYVLPRSGR